MFSGDGYLSATPEGATASGYPVLRSTLSRIAWMRQRTTSFLSSISRPTSDGGPRVAMFYDVDRRLKAVDLLFLVRAGM